MFKNNSFVILSAIVFVVTTGCSRDISFKNEIEPILNKNCLSCHATGGPGYEKSGFRVDSYEDLMKGTKFGAVIIPNSSLTSSLVMLIEHKADPSINMPHGRAPLPQKDIEQIKQWIDQGARNN